MFRVRKGGRVRRSDFAYVSEIDTTVDMFPVYTFASIECISARQALERSYTCDNNHCVVDRDLITRQILHLSSVGRAQVHDIDARGSLVLHDGWQQGLSCLLRQSENLALGVSDANLRKYVSYWLQGNLASESPAT